MDTHLRPRLPTTRLLFTQDRPESNQAMKLLACRGHYHMRLARTADEALAACREWRPHMAVVDLEIANGRLLERLNTSSHRHDRIPIIALTRRADLPTKLAAFDQGADDILSVPYFPEELVARILAVLRRAYRTTIPFASTLRLGELEIDLLNRRARVEGRELHLTAIDQCLLYLLAANAGRVLSRDEILDELWGIDFSAESNVVDRHIRNLRRKLRDDWRRPRFIATVPGRGYSFVAPATDSNSATPAP
jgi:DNA-binding response OmpR family regulator